MDFAAQLQILLREEEPPITDPLTELALAQADILGSIQKNGSNLSLQIEEIYDIIKDADENDKELRASVKRENSLLGALIALCDLLDGLLPYMQEHSQTIAAKKDEAVNACNLERLGLPGERMDPRLHTAASAEYSDAPSESITRVLESGYAYRGKVLRKATVIISKGAEST